jgi:chromate transport protein ChrA
VGAGGRVLIVGLRVVTADVVGSPCIAFCSALCPSPSAMHILFFLSFELLFFLFVSPFAWVFRRLLVVVVLVFASLFFTFLFLSPELRRNASQSPLLSSL